VRPLTRGPPAALGLAVPYWGPTYIINNVFRRHSPEGWGPPPGFRDQGILLKLKRDIAAEPNGFVYFLHNTAYSPQPDEARFMSIVPNLPKWGLHSGEQQSALFGGGADLVFSRARAGVVAQ